MLQFALIGVITISIVQSLPQFVFILKCGVFSGLLLLIRVILFTPFQRIVVRDFGLLNANSIGLSLCISLILLFLLQGVSEKRDIKYYIIASLLIVGIIFTASRKAILLLGYSLFSWTFFTTEKPLKKILIASVIIIFMGLTYYFLMNNEFLYNIIGMRFEGAINLVFGKTGYIDASSFERKVLIDKGLELWRDRPYIGYGASTFSKIAGFGIYSHNNYIELSVNLGIIGLLLFYQIYILLFVQIFKMRNTHLLKFLSFLIIFLLGLDFAWVTLVEDLYLLFLVLIYISPKFI